MSANFVMNEYLCIKRFSLYIYIMQLLIRCSSLIINQRAVQP